MEILEEARSEGAQEPREHAGAGSKKDHKTSISAIHAALGIMREGRSHLELIGRISGELDAPPPPQPGINNVLTVLLMPKTPEAAAIERERLEKFGSPQMILGRPVQPRRLEPACDTPSDEDESGD